MYMYSCLSEAWIIMYYVTYWQLHSTCHNFPHFVSESCSERQEIEKVFWESNKKPRKERGKCDTFHVVRLRSLPNTISCGISKFVIFKNISAFYWSNLLLTKQTPMSFQTDTMMSSLSTCNMGENTSLLFFFFVFLFHQHENWQTQNVYNWKC